MTKVVLTSGKEAEVRVLLNVYGLLENEVNTSLRIIDEALSKEENDIPSTTLYQLLKILCQEYCGPGKHSQRMCLM